MGGVTNSINSISGTDGIIDSTSGNNVSTAITKKGDLLVGKSLSSSQTRVPVGTNNFVFISDPTKPNGMGWSASGTGNWTSRGIYGPYSSGGNGSLMPVTFSSTGGTSFLTANRLLCFPFFIDRAWAFSKMSMTCNNLAASSVLRMGLYDATGTAGYPGNLIVDAGTIDTSTIGTKTNTFTDEIYLYGRYWCVCISDGAPGMASLGAAVSEFAQAVGRPNFSTTTTPSHLVKDSVSSYVSALPSSLSAVTFTMGAGTSNPAISIIL